MPDTHNDPWLLTPGPLTTSQETKEAMLHDWGARDAGFIDMNQRVLRRILALAEATETHECVPIQGSGTFAVEATLGTLLSKDDKALVLVNGAYGRRIARILEIAGRPFDVIEDEEDEPSDVTELLKRLQDDQDITHVIAVHCETTSGILNPIGKISDTVYGLGRKLIIDAMSSFGALRLSAKEIQFDSVVASSNKCLEGVPGMGFSIIQKESLVQSEGNSPSLSMDLFDQWRYMRTNSQWRFTPPTHIVAALDTALTQLVDEGGVTGRGERYKSNCCILVDGMRGLGFETFLSDQVQSPIIVTFKMPADPNFIFQSFYDVLKDKGFVIYPGKLTVADSFRIGCIGHLEGRQMHDVLEAVGAAMKEMNVTTGKP